MSSLLSLNRISHHLLYSPYRFSSNLLFLNGKRFICFQGLKNKKQIYITERIIRNLNNHNIIHQRNNSIFNAIRWKKNPSIFLIGFATMTIFLVLDFEYHEYRRSGLTLSEFLFAPSSKSSAIIPKLDTNEDSFETKYASLINESSIPKWKPTRIVPGTVTLPDIKLTLFQYQNCPFCCKVRTFLDYYGMPYEVIEVNPVMRQQIKFSKLYRKVPILLISMNKNNNNEEPSTSNSKDNQILQINDSTLIISALNSYILSRNPKSKHHGESLSNMIRWYLSYQVLVNEKEDLEQNNSVTFKASKTNDELINRYFLMIGDVDSKKYEKLDSLLARDRRWRRWVDDHLVHVLSPNIYRTFEESFNSFRHFSEVSEWEKNFSRFEIFTVINLGATVMYFVAKSLKKKYGLKDDVRTSLYDSCNYWLKAIGPDQKFMGGDTPSLADLNVYGVLSSIEGCEAFSDLIKNTKISDWYYSVKSMVEQHQGAKDIQHLF